MQHEVKTRLPLILALGLDVRNAMTPGRFGLLADFGFGGSRHYCSLSPN